MRSMGGGYSVFRDIGLLLEGNPYPLSIDIVSGISFLVIIFIFSRRDVSHFKLWKYALWVYFIISLYYLFITLQGSAIIGNIGLYILFNIFLKIFLAGGILCYIFSIKVNSFVWKTLLILVVTSYTLDFFRFLYPPPNLLNNILFPKWLPVFSINLNQILADFFYSLPGNFVIYQLSKNRYLKF